VPVMFHLTHHSQIMITENVYNCLPVAWPENIPRSLGKISTLGSHNYQHLKAKTKPHRVEKLKRAEQAKPKANCAQFGMTSHDLPSPGAFPLVFPFSQIHRRVLFTGQGVSCWQKVAFFPCLFNASTFARHLSLRGSFCFFLFIC